ncbi:MAG: maltooligosyltrehalose trehalohydrolase [Actinomycetota bacterium]|jgi:maltooligosyltrehalose trehalohydrolase|nr:maltooligosyltrehalose trehalohydrolase [Actinomycetota bacterium]
MTEIRVWAPNATQVELVGNSGRVLLDAGAGGWFSGRHEGEDYAFSLDGGDPRPDPRSAWQPHGVNGPSRVVDHTVFEWHDGSWTGFPLSAAIVYELHVGTFTPEGTFESAIGKLDHLVSIGVNAVELMPVAEFPGARGWGYDGVDLFAPHNAYGGPDGLKQLIDACHGLGIAVIQDVVYNHLGPAGNYLREFGPYFTDRYGTPWGEAVNLDAHASTEVRDFLIENALSWLDEYHFDGLRLDAVHAIFDQSATHFLEELSTRVDELESRLGRTKWLIAESDLNDPRLVRSREAGGYGLDAQWSDDFHHALHALLTGETAGYYSDFGTIADVAKALNEAFVYDGKHSAFRGRVHGRSAEGLEGHRFLGYLQTHDQVGNRAMGERSSALMSHELLKVGAALVLTSPFVPMLFQGEEWGATTPFLYFTDHEDVQLGRAVSEGRRREFAAFGWRPGEIPDPQNPETFERSKLDWSELDDPRHADLLEWHRQLIRLRHELPELSDGRMDRVRTSFDEGAGWLLVQRGTVSVVCNFSAGERTVPLQDPGELLLTSGKGPTVHDNGTVLAPRSVSIFKS